ncbi:MAG: hypothetical protein JSR58_05090 [Verrucomicrobia bacterium]|nr:hypothetical protein [Verrucomicrobiota bacterium]
MRKIIVLLFISCTLLASESKLQVRHRESAGIGYNKGYSTVDYTISHIGELSQFFLNARGHLFNDARFASNLGIGARRSIYDGAYLLGGNFYYDFRESKHLHTNQVGGGLEFLSRCVDVRLNGYFPVGDDTRYKHEEFLKFQGKQIIEKQKLIAALPVVDLEVGGPINSWIYLGAGPYYLFGREVRGHQLGNSAGGKAHLDMDVYKYISLGASVSYDQIFHTKVQGYLAINIPLGGKKEKTTQGRNLYDTPVYRSEIIPLHQKTRRVAYYQEDEDGKPVRLHFVNNLAAPGGDGSFESPFSKLKDAEAASQENDIIYVFQGDGTARNMNEGIVLKDGQRLASSGAPLDMENLVIPALTNGKPTITNIHPMEPIITNPGDTHLDDFFFLSPDQYYFWAHAWEGPWVVNPGSSSQQPGASNNPQPPPPANPVINPPNNQAGPPYNFGDFKVDKPSTPDPLLNDFVIMGETPTPTPLPNSNNNNNNNNALDTGWHEMSRTSSPTPTPPPANPSSNSNTGGGGWFSGWRN